MFLIDSGKYYAFTEDGFDDFKFNGYFNFQCGGEDIIKHPNGFYYAKKNKPFEIKSKQTHTILRFGLNQYHFEGWKPPPEFPELIGISYPRWEPDREIHIGYRIFTATNGVNHRSIEQFIPAPLLHYYESSLFSSQLAFVVEQYVCKNIDRFAKKRGFQFEIENDENGMKVIILPRAKKKTIKDIIGLGRFNNEEIFFRTGKDKSENYWFETGRESYRINLRAMTYENEFELRKNLTDLLKGVEKIL